MKRLYDISQKFTVITDNGTYTKSFSHDWFFTEMLEYMLDHFSVDKDTIVEIRSCYIKRYKLTKDV